MAGIKDYSTTAGNNTAINGINVAESCPPSGINNAIRQQMADTRGLYESGGWIEWGHTCTYASGTTFTVATDVTAVYVANRRIRAVGSSTGTIYGKVSSSSYSAPNTTVTVTWDSGSLSNESLTISVGWISPTGSPAGSFLSSSDIGTSVQAYDADLAAIAGLSGVRGDIIYRDASQWQRLAKGNSGDVLTMGANDPAWAAANSGAMALVSTTAISASSSVAITGLAAGYDYEICLQGFAPSGDATTLQFQVSTDNGSTWKAGASDYGWGLQHHGAGAFDDADTKIELVSSAAGTMGNDASTVNTMTVYLEAPNSSGAFKTITAFGGIMTSDTPQRFHSITGSAVYYGSTSAVNAVRFVLSDGGNFKAQGNVLVYRKARS